MNCQSRVHQAGWCIGASDTQYFHESSTSPECITDVSFCRIWRVVSDVSSSVSSSPIGEMLLVLSRPTTSWSFVTDYEAIHSGSVSFVNKTVLLIAAVTVFVSYRSYWDKSNNKNNKREQSMTCSNPVLPASIAGAMHLLMFLNLAFSYSFWTAVVAVINCCCFCCRCCCCCCYCCDCYCSCCCCYCCSLCCRRCLYYCDCCAAVVVVVVVAAVIAVAASCG